MAGQNRLQNGIQIFPGSVPIYRGTTLVGAIGVSGDGIDQDDMISFLGAQQCGAAGERDRQCADLRCVPTRYVVNVGSNQVRLRYVSCPFAPFLDTAAAKCLHGAVMVDAWPAAPAAICVLRAGSGPPRVKSPEPAR